MRSLLGFGLAFSCLLGCTSTYHPEYHPVTSTTYSHTSSSPMIVQTGTGQPVQIVPAPAQPSVYPPAAQTTVFPAPAPPPTPPASFPW